ncbi:MAG: YceI family protein [Oligoflexia bacterium]
MSLTLAFSLALAALFSLPAMASTAATAKTYKIDAAHSSASFKVKHLMSKTAGNFQDFSGSFTFDEKNPKSFSGSFTIQSKSIFTNNAKRDEHLRGADFFDVAKFPTLTFEAKEFKAAGKGKYKLAGDLTMHGVTKPVSFDVEYLGGGKDPWGNEKVGFTAATKVNRKDFGLTWNKVLEAGGLLVGEEVEIEVQIEADATK